MKKDGFVLLGAMTQDNNYDVTDVSDCAEWAEAFDITHPILADVAAEQNKYALLGFPTFVVIDRDMTIVNSDLWPFDADYIRDVVAQ